jgi:hypothetical protein
MGFCNENEKTSPRDDKAAKVEPHDVILVIVGLATNCGGRYTEKSDGNRWVGKLE